MTQVFLHKRYRIAESVILRARFAINFSTLVSISVRWLGNRCLVAKEGELLS
jgi:hypothetical protein